MFKHPLSVGPSEHLEELLTLFVQYQFRWLPVTSNEKLVGMIKRDDVLAALFDEPDSMEEELLDSSGR